MYRAHVVFQRTPRQSPSASEREVRTEKCETLAPALLISMDVLLVLVLLLVLDSWVADRQTFEDDDEDKKRPTGMREPL